MTGATIEEGTADGSVQQECTLIIHIFPFGDTAHNEEPICDIHVASGQAYNGITFHNVKTEGSGLTDLIMEANVEDEVESLYSKALCEEVGSSTEDSYEGKISVTGENELEKAVDVTVEGTPGE